MITIQCFMGNGTDFAAGRCLFRNHFQHASRLKNFTGVFLFILHAELFCASRLGVFA